MPAPKKSVFRAPEAQHFQLVHRSQQDPLINDPEASQRVFKPVTRGNDQKPEITLADLENTIDKSSIRQNEGEATLYGITYDDSSYDYMSHLKPVGAGGVAESVMIAAPRGSGIARGMKAAGKGKGKAKEDDMFGLLPEDVLPSRNQMSVYEAQTRGEAIPSELQGLQPDMDPHLRQVLEALDDDAFVDEDGEDESWFGQLVGEGERDDEEEVPWEFSEWGVDEASSARSGVAPQEAKEETWEDRFRAFKKQQAALPDEVSEAGQEDEDRSEMADTLGTLRSNFDDMMVVGGKKRRGKRGPSDASGMSMSSSSMFRTQGLRDLDDRFDKVEMDYLYDDEEEEEYEDFPDDDTASVAASNFSVSSRFSLASHASRAPSGPPELSRDDFETIMDDFLENYEVVGRKYRPALGGTALTGTEKLSVLRAAIEGEGEAKEENTRRILQIELEDRERSRNKEKSRREPKEKVVEHQEEKWDVESILSTYTNTENHPGMIRSRTAAQAKARAEAQAAAAAAQAEQAVGSSDEDEDEDDSGSETEREGPKVTVTREKGESAQEKKARKAAVKAERSARRAEKKSHKETFSTERKRQLASHKKLVSNGRAADVAVGAKGVVSLR